VAAARRDGTGALAEAIRDMDLLPVLGRVRAPTLVVAGLQDPSTPPDHAVHIAAGIPGAWIAVLDPARHVPTVERPEAVTDLLLEHLGGEARSV
jgi:3-oxoadipate enol-lactonase